MTLIPALARGQHSRHLNIWTPVEGEKQAEREREKRANHANGRSLFSFYYDLASPPTENIYVSVVSTGKPVDVFFFRIRSMNLYRKKIFSAPTYLQLLGNNFRHDDSVF